MLVQQVEKASFKENVFFFSSAVGLCYSNRANQAELFLKNHENKKALYDNMQNLLVIMQFQGKRSHPVSGYLS